MASPMTPIPQKRQPSVWPLRSFGLGAFFMTTNAEMQLEIRLDQGNSEFGLASINPGVSSVVATLVKSLDGEAMFFPASSAVAACFSPSVAESMPSTKVTLRFPNQQLDIIFETYNVADSFLATLKCLAKTSFVLYHIPAMNSKYQRMNFDMAKSGFAGAGTLPLTVESNSISSAHIQHGSTLLWNTKEWTDFVVSAGSQEFKGHKAILCPCSQFFANACRPNFMEGIQGRIRLDEDETTVETLLMEIYGVENNKTGAIFTTFAPKHENEKEFIITTLLKLFIAADKYGLEHTKARAVEAIADRLPFIEDHLTMASLASLSFDFCPDNDFGLRSTVLDHVAARLQPLLDNVEAKAELMSNTFIMGILLFRLGKLEVAVRNSDIKGGGNLESSLTPPTTPERMTRSGRVFSRTSSS